MRVDYQASQKLRLTAKYAGQNATVQTNPGSIPGFNDQVFQFPAILVPSATVTYTLNSSTVLEGTYGLTQGNQLGNVPMSPVTNRNAVGLGNFPLLYPNNGARARGLVSGEGAAGDGRAVLHQRPRRDGAELRVGQPHRAIAPPNNAVSAVPLHAEHARRGHRPDEALGLAHVQGRVPVAGQHEAAEPRHRHARRAAVRRARQLRERQQQPARFGVRVRERRARRLLAGSSSRTPCIEGDYVYHNKDFYIQDNWKVNSRLTLDYRHAVHASRPAVRRQAAGVELLPRPVVGEPGAAALRAGMRERLGRRAARAWRWIRGPARRSAPGSSVAIGTIVPNTGTLLNGIIQAGNGIAKENYTEQSLVVRAAHRRGLRRDGHAADRRSRQRRRLLRSPAGGFDLRPDRQPADRAGLDRRQLDAAAGRAGHGRRAAAARHAHL